MNGADGISDIEGKVTRVSGEGVGKRPSFKFVTKTLHTQKEAAVITFVFQDITNWKKGTEHINGLELFFEDRDHLIEKWETLKPRRNKNAFRIRTDSEDVTHVFRVISSESCG